MNKVDKKIKLILSKELEVPNKFRETVNSCIDNLPELIQIVTIGILSIGVTAFAHSEIQKIEKSKINQNVSEVNDEIKVDTYYDSNGIEMHQYNFKYPLDTNDWESTNLYEYLKITTMKEYNEYKEKYADVFELEKMTEEDFENNYLLVLIMVENSYIYDVNYKEIMKIIYKEKLLDKINKVLKLEERYKDLVAYADKYMKEVIKC